MSRISVLTCLVIFTGTVGYVFSQDSKNPPATPLREPSSAGSSVLADEAKPPAAQPPEALPREERRGPGERGPGGRGPSVFGAGGFGPGGTGGFGGPGGPMGPERKLLKDYDKDGNGWLNQDERKTARASLKQAGKRPGRGFGPPRGMGQENQEPPKPGVKLSPADIKPVDNAPLYEPSVLRTYFLDFEDADWEQALEDFSNSDVDIPATLTVDGRRYPNVGVHFRGMSSYFTVAAGFKRSLNVSLDFVDKKQRLYGYKTLNLLNSHEDSSHLHTVLYFDIARRYLPAPKANFAKVVINNESWGIYSNVEQFNKDFLAQWFPSSKGSRWKVPGSPFGKAGLTYLGDKTADYERLYQLKTDDGERAWPDLIELCRTLDKTPLDQLEAKLQPKLNIDSALWFLALENALINSDGYWIRASDYNLYRDPTGKFHLVPHDANETFQPAMGPGSGGMPSIPGLSALGFAAGASRGVELDPLVGLDDANKPLRSRLLAVPAIRDRYLQNVRTIATDWLDWNKLEPVVRQYQALIETELTVDTRKLSSVESFRRAVADPSVDAKAPTTGRRPTLSLKTFAEQRQAYLLDHPAIKKLPAK